MDENREPDITDDDEVVADTQDTVISEGAAVRRVVGAGAETVPDRIGGFRIVSPLGAGGMGIVYAAVQDQPRRTVALKILRPDLLSEDIQRRFDTEAEVLGRLQHDGIARIYETGRIETPFGSQPYYAMELVEGVEIVDFAERRDLDHEARVELALGLVDAVHAAHMKGVIHRDIKPANVLVTEDGRVKVLDFGLARLTDAAHDAMRTMTGQLVGTLNYMSPEQAEGLNDAIDVRTDVYSLGVIIYQLLSGELPIETKGVPLAEAVRFIRDRDPKKLGQLVPELRGDLELIVDKALAKDVGRRYESAAALAVDLRNFLRHDPVSARPSSGFYRLSKFARRHRVIVASCAVVLVFVAIASVVSLRYALEAQREAERAERAGFKAAQEAARAEKEATARLVEAERAEEAAKETLLQVDRTRRYSRFIIDTFANLDPAVAAGREMTLREAFVEVEKKFESALIEDPYSRAELHNLFGQLWRSFGDYERSRLHAEAAVELAQELEDADAMEGIALQTLAWIEFREGRLDDARDDLETSLEILEETDNENTLSYAWGVATLAEVAAAALDYGEAERLALDALARRKRLVPGDHREVAESHIILANIYVRRDAVAKARHHAEASLEMRRRLYGDLNPTVGESLSLLANCALQEGKDAEAARLLEESYGIQKRTLPPGSRALAVAEVNLGYLAFLSEDHAAAEMWYAKSLDSFRRLFGPGNFESADVHAKLALTRQYADDVEGARSAALAALETCRRNDGRSPATRRLATEILAKLALDDEPAAAAEYYLEAARAATAENGRLWNRTLELLGHASQAFFNAGESERAIEIQRDLLARTREEGAANPTYLAAALLNLGSLLEDAGRHEESESALLEAYDVARRLDDEAGKSWLERIKTALAAHFEARGLPGRAREFRDDD